MQFTKMHGLENDYIYIDTFTQCVPDPVALSRVVSDRYAGIGSDGLILIGAPDASAMADVRMRMFNADGSEAQMCGNGIRCVAKFAIERHLASRNPLRVQTGRGTLNVSWSADAQGQVQEVSVDMGLPILEMAKIPAKIEGFSPQDQVIGAPLSAMWWSFDTDSSWKQACGYEAQVSLVSMGNPHAIFWCNDVSQVPLARIGAMIEKHASFPQRVNAHFAQRDSSKRVIMRTWERGSGITRACGTGACAVLVAGVLEKKLDNNCELVLLGGALRGEWAGLGHSVIMSGPAVEVCHGTISKQLLEKAK